MPDTPTLWRAGDDGRPMQVSCPNGTAYPAEDSTGKTICDNTHFATEADCWADTRWDAELRQKFAVQNVDRAQRMLDEAKAELFEAAVHRSRLDEAHERWRKSLPREKTDA